MPYDDWKAKYGDHGSGGAGGSHAFGSGAGSKHVRNLSDLSRLLGRTGIAPMTDPKLYICYAGRVARPSASMPKVFLAPYRL